MPSHNSASKLIAWAHRKAKNEYQKLEHFYAAKLVGQGPGEPSPQGRVQQRRGADKAGLAVLPRRSRSRRRQSRASWNSGSVHRLAAQHYEKPGAVPN